jgi:sugar/nucleoside kinase (ribokinase family)
MTPMPAPKTMSVGGATFDLFVVADHSVIHKNERDRAFTLPLGSKIRVEEVIRASGGGAHNTAVGLARLGCAASYCGVIGDDAWGASVLDNCAKENVDTAHVTVVENEATDFSIILTARSGERVILKHPGTSKHLQDATFARDAAAEVDWLYLNSIQEEACQIEDDLIRILTEIPHARLTWNPGGCQIDMGVKRGNIQAMLRETTLLLLNKEEALTFTGEPDVLSAMKRLLALGTKMVCITDGAEGVLATDGKIVYHCLPADCTVVDTTGAGDAFGTGATWALLTGKNLPTALRAGTINAMSVVGSVGAQPGLLTAATMEKRLAESDITVTETRL